MTVYISIYLFNFILGAISFFKIKKNFLYKISFIVLSSILCLKYLNGIDWINYEKWYYDVELINNFFSKKNLLYIENKGAEISFFMLMSIFRTLKINYEMFQYIILTFCMYIVYIFFGKVTKYRLCAISFYFCSFMLVNYLSPAMRQILALTFFLIYILLNENKQKYLAYFCLFLGISFHYSLAIIIPLLFFVKREFPKKAYIFFTIIILFVNFYITEIAMNVLSQINFLNKYLQYFTNSYSGGKNFNLIIEIIRVFIYLGILFFIKENNIKENKVNINFILNMFFLNFTFNIFRLRISSFERLEHYTIIFFIISVTYILEILAEKNKKRGLIAYLIMSIYFFKVLITIINWYKEVDPLRYIPYTNYIIEILKENEFNDSFKKIEYRKDKMDREGVLKLLKK